MMISTQEEMIKHESEGGWKMRNNPEKRDQIISPFQKIQDRRRHRR
jgi:hypothetical protein